MFFKKTFAGGVHPPGFKELTNKKPIKRLEVPPEVSIPLLQHTGAPCTPVVKPGDYVKAGTLIGTSDKPVFSYVHSSISGIVKAIKPTCHPITGKCSSVVIESDKKDESEEQAWLKEGGVETLGPEDIRNIIKQAGVVGLGGAGFPTHIKLNPPKEKPVDTVILNGAECEPYLTCDERVMIEQPNEVLEGFCLIMKALCVNKGYVAVEDNKPDAVNAMRKGLGNIKHKDVDIKIAVLATKYPQGGEKQLIKAISKREVPAGGLPFDVGCLVDNVQTAFAVYEAVYKGKPLYERTLTATGDALKNPANLIARIGTPISFILEKCGGLQKALSKIIMGGPMMGIAQYTADTPVIKGTSGIIFLSKESTYEPKENTCIRCGRCIMACPMGLMPTAIMHFVKKERFKEAKDMGVANCFECGACAYECPAKVPLLDYMKFGKAKV